MNIKPVLAITLAFSLAGCSTLTTSYVDCHRLSREKQQVIGSDLNRLLVSRGFAQWPDLNETNHLARYPWTVGLWHAPLRNGSADFTVSAYGHPHEMWLYVDTYRLSLRRANITITKAIVAFIQSNAPNARIEVQENTEFFPLFPPD